MDLGGQGFLTFEPVEAGAKYYNANSLEYAVYKYSGIYFINFNMENKISDFGEVLNDAIKKKQDSVDNLV